MRERERYATGALLRTGLTRALSAEAQRVFDRLIASRGVEPAARMLNVNATTVERFMHGGKWRPCQASAVEARLREAPMLEAYRSEPRFQRPSKS